MLSSFLGVAPEALAAASAGLSRGGQALREATSAAAPSTTGIAAAAKDEVSAAIAKLFGTFGQNFQASSVQSESFRDRFVQAFNAGAEAYERTETTSASPLQTLENDVMGAVNTPSELLAARPLVGNGADGAPGTGQAGGAGGIIAGNGGNGGSGRAGWSGRRRRGVDRAGR